MNPDHAFLAASIIALAIVSSDAHAQSNPGSRDWLQGLMLKPHLSIDSIQCAAEYAAHPERWNSAVAFIKGHNLDSIPKGSYPIIGDTVYASVTEDSSKDFEKTKWESHRKYVDLQYVIRGEEKIGVCPVTKATVTIPYNAARDVANYNAEGTYYSAVPGTFFLFFPTDAHRPNVTPGGNKIVKKLVIKIRASEISR